MEEEEASSEEYFDCLEEDVMSRSLEDPFIDELRSSFNGFGIEERNSGVMLANNRLPPTPTSGKFQKEESKTSPHWHNILKETFKVWGRDQQDGIFGQPWSWCFRNGADEKKELIEEKPKATHTAEANIGNDGADEAQSWRVSDATMLWKKVIGTESNWDVQLFYQIDGGSDDDFYGRVEDYSGYENVVHDANETEVNDRTESNWSLKAPIIDPRESFKWYIFHSVQDLMLEICEANVSEVPDLTRNLLDLPISEDWTFEYLKKCISKFLMHSRVKLETQLKFWTVLSEIKSKSQTKRKTIKNLLAILRGWVEKTLKGESSLDFFFVEDINYTLKKDGNVESKRDKLTVTKKRIAVSARISKLLSATGLFSSTEILSNLLFGAEICSKDENTLRLIALCVYEVFEVVNTRIRDEITRPSLSNEQKAVVQVYGKMALAVYTQEDRKKFSKELVQFVKMLVYNSLIRTFKIWQKIGVDNFQFFIEEVKDTVLRFSSACETETEEDHKCHNADCDYAQRPRCNQILVSNLTRLNRDEKILYLPTYFALEELIDKTLVSDFYFWTAQMYIMKYLNHEEFYSYQVDDNDLDLLETSTTL